MNQYLYILRPTRPAMLDSGPTAEEAATVERHAVFISDLVEKEIALLAGRTLAAGEHALGIVILRAESDAEARSIMEADPAVIDKVMTSEIFPYRVAFLAEETGSWFPGGARPEPLRTHLDKLLSGEGAHEPIKTMAQSFPENFASRKIPGSTATAWRLMEHLRIAQWDILEFCRDAAAHISPQFPEGYWPSGDHPPDRASWGDCVESFLRDLGEMRRLVTDPANNLYHPIPNGTGQTLLREALLVADHNAYHLGQLMQLKKIVENQ